MKTLVIYSRSSTQRPRSVAVSLCDWLIDQGHEVSLLDVSDFSYANQDLPPRWFARLFGHDVFPQAFTQALDKLGVTYKQIRYQGRNSRDLPPTVSDELQNAVFSDLVTYLRSDDIDLTGGYAGRVATTMRKKASELYFALLDYLAAERFDQVYVPNGRVPEQRLALEACKERNFTIRYYEIGRAKPQSFYAGKTQVHDREGTQDEVHEVLAGLTAETIAQMATDWLHERTKSGSSINVYSAGWSSETKATEKGGSRAIFFSSSADEFASYGASWKLDSWANQYEAFGAIMTLLETQGVVCELRVHPNLTNKNASYFVREVKDITDLQAKHPNLHVYWHNHPVNSYDLVAQSDYVIVGRSTLGLEASLMGKCVWATTAARYDRIADVKTAWSPKDINVDNFALWNVDETGAQRFVAYWSLQDHPFTFGEDQWCTWDSFRTEGLLRMGQLLINNPLPHKIHLVGLELTKIRNTRFQPETKPPLRQVVD